MPRRRYDIIAVDLDGTLIDHNGLIHADNLAAIRRARAAGIMVTICTGRALVETREVIARIEQTDPVIVAGGAMVAEPQSGRTLERFTMPLELVRRVADHLHTQEHPVLLLKDPHAAGFDYLAVTPWGPDAIDPASKWWFKKMGVNVHYTDALEHDEHPEHTVRVGAYAANTPITELADDLRTRFGGEVMLQHFNGVLLPTDRRDDGIESVHIVEMFNPLADKWQALERLARRLGIPPERTAAIGDQTNDLSMITHAGLGVAMGNAHASVAKAADRQTLACDQGGVAHALEQILAGEW